MNEKKIINRKHFAKIFPDVFKAGYSCKQQKRNRNF